MRTSLAACLGLALLFPASVWAQSTWQVTVSAGDVDRANVPVRKLVTIPHAEADATIVELTGEGGKLVGQLTKPGLLTEVADGKPNAIPRELHFIVPSLKAGEKATWQAKVVRDASPTAQFAWKDTTGKHMDLMFGERPVLRYMYERVDNSTKERRSETFKVYHHMYDPAGERLVTKGAGGLFPHHRGVFYGFNKISYDGKTADTWHCNNGESQTHEKFLAEEAGPVLARHLLAIDWHGKDDAVFAKEQREITIYNTADGVLLEFASRLKTTGGNVKLDGDPQHAGFQFRASQEVPDKTAKQTYYLRPDGKGTPGQFRNWPGQKDHANLPWNALSFVIGDQRYTCAYLDRASNPKESRFSERDYGRFGSYFEYELTPDKPLDLNYRLWLQNGEMTVEGVNAKAKDFVAPPEVQVKA
jgi:hypothetical protein